MFTSRPSGFLPKDFKEMKYAWKAPSNIAIIKYWGKRGEQRPANPNFSFTLKTCVTQTKVRFGRREESEKKPWISVFLGGKPKESFLPPIQTFLERISPYCPWIKKVCLTIETFNSFPHGTGMASSASGMAALALCLNSFHQKFFPEREGGENFYQQSSFLARLGSGSACRSLFPGGVTWGVHSEEYASPFPHLHPTFKKMRNIVLVVSEEEKKISSRAGHAKMQEHLFKEVRYRQAGENWKRLEGVLRQGDFSQFVEICEEEALTLHAMMMTSRPPAFLLSPSTLTIMQKIPQWRSWGIPLCYTLDAGPNIHLLFPSEAKAQVLSLIRDELLPLAPQIRWVDDCLGEGPEPWMED